MAAKAIKVFSSGRTVSNLNLATTLWINTSVSSRAYSFPAHIRGPPPKGAKAKGSGPFPSNLDGSNFSGLGKYLGFLFVVCTDQYVCNNTKYEIAVGQACSQALNSIYIAKLAIKYLPSFWNGETCKSEVHCGLSETSLGRG